jgi:Zn-finger nucleic acid-binding protein
MPLFEGPTRDVTLLGCGQCGGVWLDNEASRRLVQGVDRDLTELSERVASHASVRADPSPKGLSCPACSQGMARTRVPGTTIDLDVCAPHGTWFDAHELKVVALAYAPLPAPMRANSEAELRAYHDLQRHVEPADAGRLALRGIGMVLAAMDSLPKL